MSADYLVSEIKVTGSFKNWTDTTRENPQGVSGGSEVSFTVIPNEHYWNASEAEVIGFELRMKIHIMLMADAQMRGVQLPASAHSALVSYQEKVKILRNGHGEPQYRDAEVSSPAPPLVTDQFVDDPTSVIFDQPEGT